MQKKTRKKSVQRQAIILEKEEGSISLIKASISALNRVLVENNICTEDQLRTAFETELLRRRAKE